MSSLHSWSGFHPKPFIWSATLSTPALQSPRRVFAVDMNPLQNALLEFKLAAIRCLDYDDFFAVFREGVHPNWQALYQKAVRPELLPEYRAVWDRRLDSFDGTHRRMSFYFRGTSGLFAWMINGYLNRPPRLTEAIAEILAAVSVQQQCEIYESRGVHDLLWTRSLRWVLRRDTTTAMLGVPRSQRLQIDRGYAPCVFALPSLYLSGSSGTN